jgi:Tfp pilus assembly protein FimT
MTLTSLNLRCWCCRYSNPETALNCGSVLRDCIRSAPIAKCAARLLKSSITPTRGSAVWWICAQQSCGSESLRTCLQNGAGVAAF